MAILARMGRPPLPDKERREKPLRIRLSLEERAEVEKAAKGKTSTWARDILLRAAKRLNKQS